MRGSLSLVVVRFEKVQAGSVELFSWNDIRYVTNACLH
jgi:hypothetical protein